MKKQKNKFEGNKLKTKAGITLIALVVTIVVLLILAGVTISMLSGENGIITQAQNAKDQTEIARIKEEAELVKASTVLDALSDITQNSEIEKSVLIKVLNEHFEGSTLENNKIITADGRYDIIVDEQLNITVVKRNETKNGMVITSNVLEDSNGNMTIELNFEINGQKSIMQYIYEYIDTIEEGKNATQLEAILEDMTEGTDNEIVFEDSLRSEYQNMGNQMGMTYEQVLRYMIIMYQGEEMIKFYGEMAEVTYNYYCEYLDIQPSNDSNTLEAQYVEATEYDGTFEDALIANKEYTKEQAQQEATNVGITYELWLKEAIGSAYDGRMFINGSIQTGETFQVPLSSAQYKYTVIENGAYKFTATGSKGEEAEITVDVVIYEGDYEVAADSLGIIPRIDGEQMLPVKYDNENQEWIEADPSVQGDWFDYSSKKWANVKTKNGYFVYIPRFAYKITSGYHESLENAGTIAIVFLNEDNTIKSTIDSEGNTVSQDDLITAEEVTSSVSGTAKNATTNYIIHPAFTTFDTEENKVDGLWVAKYEMSSETINKDTELIVSKLGVVCGRETLNDAFDYTYNMNRELDSHMIKNTEWGAVAYLTVSQYGKGATNEVEKNASEYKTYYSITGCGADGTLSTGAASTTGNMYGIFDMSGGGRDFVAGYLDDASLIDETYDNYKNLREAGERYKDVYKVGTTNNLTNCYTANNLKVGDATWEISSDVSGKYGWFNDYIYFLGVGLSIEVTQIMRGGDYDDTSVGIFSYFGGMSSHGSVRAVFVVN